MNIAFPKAVHDAYLDVLAESSQTNWVLFGYDKNSNDLRVNGSGDGGLEELAEEWDDAKIQYAFCRVLEPISKLPKYVLMSWCGDGVPVSKKGLLNSHLSDVVKYFKGFHIQVNARDESDVDPALVMKKVQTSSGAKYGIHQEKAPKAPDVIAPVGSVYEPVRTNPKSLSESNNVSGYNSAPTSSAAFTPAYRNPAAEIEQLKQKERQADEERQQRKSVSSQNSSPARDFDRFRERESVSSQRSSPARDIERFKERERAAQEEREAEDARRARESEARARENQERERATREREERDREERARREVEERDRQRDIKLEEEKRQEQARARVPSPPPAVSTEGQLTAIALYPYTAQEDNEIDFEENEIITGVEQLDEGWWQGCNAKGRMGLFPANYVELTTNVAPTASVTDAVPEPPTEVGGDYHEAIALYDYEAVEENEVSFATGDKVTHIVFVSEDWWQGRVNGVEVPGNYVELSSQ
ncbi:hypothetical protein HDU67_008214 [Dinochytrium kinnereticum]|nr:hypothetical protein HDU67_008214 [Dinochytrium kinnereticum]